jgi:hypothetical protein
MKTDSTAFPPASSCRPRPLRIRSERVPRRVAGRGIFVREQVDQRAFHARVQRLPEADDGHAVLAEQAIGVLAETRMEQVN